MFSVFAPIALSLVMCDCCVEEPAIPPAEGAEDNDYQLTVSVTDGNGNTVDQDITVSVDNVVDEVTPVEPEPVETIDVSGLQVPEGFEPVGLRSPFGTVCNPCLEGITTCIQVDSHVTKWSPVHC